MNKNFNHFLKSILIIATSVELCIQHLFSSVSCDAVSFLSVTYFYAYSVTRVVFYNWHVLLTSLSLSQWCTLNVLQYNFCSVQLRGSQRYLGKDTYLSWVELRVKFELIVSYCCILTEQLTLERGRVWIFLLVSVLYCKMK